MKKTDKKMDGGKGDSPRPFSVDSQKFSENWERIFGKKLTQDTEEFIKSEDPVI